MRDLRRVGTYQPVGFLDDAAALARQQGAGRAGAGHGPGSRRDRARNGRQVAGHRDAVGRRQRRCSACVAACERTGLPFRMVPRLQDVLEGRSLPGELKEVAIEDLLGRKPVLPDWKSIRGWLGARTVLVTGAGGSIGSELCRQCARHGARRIVLVEIDELALTMTEATLRRDFPDLECIPVLGDCGDPAVMQHALRLAEPDAVFHAAAYKQVPLLEAQLREAVRNNVLATHTVARACRGAWRRHVRPDLHRQGGRPGQRAGRHQAPGRDGLPGAWPTSAPPASSPCGSATCSIRPAAWCRCSASRSAAAGRSRSRIRRSRASS